MEHLHLIDWIIIASFLLLTFGIGIWTSRGVKKSSDLFLSGRSLGPVLQFFINFGQMTDSNGAPVIATEVYRQGVGGMWIGFQMLFLTPIYWFSSIWFRRTRLMTGSDLFIDRFNSLALARTFAWYFVFLVPMYIGFGNIVTYKVAASIFTKPESAYTAAEKQEVLDFRQYQVLKKEYQAGQLPAEDNARYQELDSRNNRNQLSSYVSYLKPVPFYIGYTLFVGGYIILGGIKAAAMTDAIQGILIIIFSVMMIPLGLTKVGGFAGLHRLVPDEMFQLLGGGGSNQYAWYTIAAIILSAIVAIPMPTWITNNAAARDETALRVGMLAGGFSKRLVTICWMYCGLLAFALFPHQLSDPDQAWGILSGDLLGPGLLGFMISGMLLGHMPMVGVAAVNFSASFTRNIYQDLFPGRSSRTYLIVAQASIAFVLLTGIATALLFDSIIEMFITISNFVTFMGALAWLIYFWRRLTPQAVGASFAIWVFVTVILAWGLPEIPSFRQCSMATMQTTAPATGQIATPLFFNSLAHVNPDDVTSPVEGVGRFQVEAFIAYWLGFPLKGFNSAGLLATRWFFSCFVPFILLISLSYLLPRNWCQVNKSLAGATLRDEKNYIDEYIRCLVEGNRALPVRVNETPAEEELRIRRFYAKLQTPIGLTNEEDEKQLLTTFLNPYRYDHLKIFPRSNWEFTVWSRTDVLGFSSCCVIVVVILVLLWFLLKLGT